MTLSVNANIADNVDLLGKSASDLQEDITISNGVIRGKLKKVTGYTGFSGNVSEQSGHYIALNIDVPNTTADTITVEIIGGTSGAVTLDSDRLFVGKIKNTNQQIKVVATADGQETVTKIYDLSGLTLED